MFLVLSCSGKSRDFELISLHIAAALAASEEPVYTSRRRLNETTSNVPIMIEARHVTTEHADILCNVGRIQVIRGDPTARRITGASVPLLSNVPIKLK